MPTSPLKRPSGGGGGRLRRLLASLRSPTRAGPLPVQTGFPTSLADIVVKNHSRLRNSRRRHRAAPAPPAAVTEPQQRRELSLDHDALAAGGPVAAGPGRGAGGGGFSIRPGILAAGGAVAALALLVIWSKQLVAVATLASVAMSWIEYVRSDGRCRSETDLRRGLVSPVLDREAAVESSPRRQSCGSDDGGSDAASLWSANSGDDLVCDGSSSVAVNHPNPKVKQSRRRSLRKLLADKLRNGSKTPRGTDSRHGGEPERPETTRRVHAELAADAPAEETRTTPRAPEAITDDDDDRDGRRQRGQALALPALVPIILAGLVAGKLPALALAVLCAAFSSSSVERVPAAGQASSR